MLEEFLKILVIDVHFESALGIKVCAVPYI